MGSCLSKSTTDPETMQEPNNAIYGTGSLTPPKTPPPETDLDIVYNKQEWGNVRQEPISDNSFLNDDTVISAVDEDVADFNIAYQEVLLLHGPKQRYVHTRDHTVPQLNDDREMLVKVQAIGLNPIDWKAPDFGFGLPALPCVSGRDLGGKVVKTPASKSRFRNGDTVMGISTDYRDSRKAAFQEYAVVSDFNACRIPHHLSVADAAPLGVAFVAAALALGICIGLKFSGGGNVEGPDLLQTIRSRSRDTLPDDVRAECFDGIGTDERARPGDWIAIWGASSASGCCAVQLAKLAGLKVIAVLDVARSGERTLSHGADLLVDRHVTGRAISILKGITRGKLRFGLDTRGKESASLLAQAMQAESEGGNSRAHLVGLTGLPKETTAGVAYHSVPIKVFHEAPAVGEGLMIWLETLLDQKLLDTPETEVADGGLEGINAALDRLRDGTVNGPRIVVPLHS